MTAVSNHSLTTCRSSRWAVKVVGTGGWVKQVAAETDCIDIVDSELTLTGLRLIYEMNR